MYFQNSIFNKNQFRKWINSWSSPTHISTNFRIWKIKILKLLSEKSAQLLLHPHQKYYFQHHFFLLCHFFIHITHFFNYSSFSCHDITICLTVITRESLNSCIIFCMGWISVLHQTHTSIMVYVYLVNISWVYSTCLLPSINRYMYLQMKRCRILWCIRIGCSMKS